MACLRTLFAMLVLSGPVCASDWPQWLGPRRDGTSTEVIPVWKEKPVVLWRQSVGEGHSSPVVSQGKVILHTRIPGKEEEEIQAFDARNGQPQWHSTYPRSSFQSQFGSGPRATPAVVGSQVFTVGVTGVVTCAEAGTGKILWQVDTLAKFQAPNLLFGISCSPLVSENQVIVTVGKGTTFVAFDKDKGEVLWKSLSDPASYSSPILVSESGLKQVVGLTQQGVVSLNPRNGEVYWKYPLVDTLSESSTTPVHVKSLLLASSVTFGSVGLDLGSKEGQPGMKQVWKNPLLTCYFSTPVPVHDKEVYMVTGTIFPPPRATLRCVDLSSGKEHWHKVTEGKYHASLLRTGDNKLLMLDDGGNLSLLQPDAKEFKELVKSKVCGMAWAHPALADGLLYLRDEKELICLDMRLKGE